MGWCWGSGPYRGIMLNPRTARLRRVVLLTSSLVVLACGATSVSAASKTTKVTAKSTASKSAVDPNAPEVLSPGDIPDNIAFVPYQPAGGGYGVTTPEGWSRKTTSTGAVFTDKYNIIQVESMASQAAPTPASALAIVKKKFSASKGFVLGKSVTVKRKAGTAVLVTYALSSVPNEVTGKTIAVAVERYEFHRGGTSVVLTLSGATGADNVDPWKIVTDSFAWV